MSIRIATCAWGDSFENCCAEAARAGYAGIEINIDGYAGREGELRDLLDRHGLEAAAGSAGGGFLDPATRESEIAQVEQTARRLAAFGVYTLELHCGLRPVGGPSEEQLRHYAEALNEVGRRCRRHGVRVGLHNHCILFIETGRDIDLLYQHLDPELMGAGFDTGHLALAGCDVAEVARRYAGRFVYGHLKDLYQVSKPAGESERVLSFDETLALVQASDIYTWLAIEDVDGRRVVLGGGKLGHDLFAGHRGLIRGVRCCDITEYQFAELGQGFIDLPGTLAALQHAGYEGWLAVELDVCYRTRFESARMSREYLRSQLQL